MLSAKQDTKWSTLTSTIAVRLPRQEYNDLLAQAAAAGVPVAELVRCVLAAWYEWPAEGVRRHRGRPRTVKAG